MLVGYVVCTLAGIATFVVLQWARHRQFLKYRDTGFVPSTQHWVAAATLIAGIFFAAAFVFLVLWLKYRNA
jgi:hypothetical protein